MLYDTDTEIEVLIFFASANRIWHLTEVGCQGFLGPVPPPFCISITKQ